jgi:hypothetical protein
VNEADFLLKRLPLANEAARHARGFRKRLLYFLFIFILLKVMATLATRLNSLLILVFSLPELWQLYGSFGKFII